MKKIKFKNPIGNTKCKRCGNIFYNPKRTRKYYCSENCKMWALRERARNNAKRLGSKRDISKICTKICKYCNKEFNTNYHLAKYCSKECGKKYANYRYSQGESNNFNNQFLKLRFEIFKRDDFTCQYCGRNVKEDKVKLQVDHILPKSKGGELKIENLITSCFECNQGKKDILLSERINKKEKINNANF